MTIDERIEKLTERHEALAQSVELIAIGQRKTEEHLDRLTARVEGLAERVEGLVERVEGLVESVEELTEGMQGLLTIARSHEARIARLEDGV